MIDDQRRRFMQGFMRIAFRQQTRQGAPAAALTALPDFGDT